MVPSSVPTQIVQNVKCGKLLAFTNTLEHGRATSQHDVGGHVGRPALPQATAGHCEQGVSVATTEGLVHDARQFEHHGAAGRDSAKPCDCRWPNAGTRK